MITSSIKQFKYYKQLADKALAQIQPDQLCHRYHEDDNSIAIIIQHMSGNMKSRWTNIFTEDGEKMWRKRDEEFEPITTNVEEIFQLWNDGWQVLFQTLEHLSDSDLDRIIYVRNEGMTVSDAILRQLCHYSYHCGQIVYKCKQLSGDHWQTLSIAKNQSEVYNFKKFEQIAEQKHFLDSLLEQGS
jgi:hypothetical protein